MFYSLKADESDFSANTRIILFRERKLEDLFTIVTVIKYFGWWNYRTIVFALQRSNAEFIIETFESDFEEVRLQFRILIL